MVWWLFKRKRDEDVLRKLKEMETRLEVSFSNIKKDMKVLNTKVLKQDQRISSLYKKFHLTNPKKELKQQLLQQKQLDITNREDIFEGLTDTQQQLFLKLILLQKEGNQDWVTMRYLTQEAYPNKDPLKIRSTISMYLAVLSDLGLIKKKRSGREILISISDNIKQHIKNLPSEKELKINNNQKKYKEQKDSEDNTQV